MKEVTFRLAGIVRQSIVDGPGLRMAVFTQGCPHHCPGCHNPQSHVFDGGNVCTVEKIMKLIDENPLLRGITLTGGEPFSQPGAMAVLAEESHQRGKNVWCYSGYTLEELLGMKKSNLEVERLLLAIDVLVDGRYLESERDLTLRFRGSSNQRILNAPRSLAEGKAVWEELPD